MHFAPPFWDLQTYLGSGSGPEPEAASEGLNLEDIDASIRSSLFWTSLGVLNLLMKVVRTCILWSESCPCHFHLLDQEDVPNRIYQAWLQCPMSGRRLAELSSGDFMEMISSLFDNLIAQAIALMPPSLSGKDRANLLEDLSRGRAHLVFQFTLKLSAMQQPPRLLHASSHHNRW